MYDLKCIFAHFDYHRHSSTFSCVNISLFKTRATTSYRFVFVQFLEFLMFYGNMPISGVSSVCAQSSREWEWKLPWILGLSMCSQGLLGTEWWFSCLIGSYILFRKRFEAYKRQIHRCSSCTSRGQPKVMACSHMLSENFPEAFVLWVCGWWSFLVCVRFLIISVHVFWKTWKEQPLFILTVL